MYELKVENMTCGHCVGRVTDAVKSIDPAAKVTADLPTKIVRIDSTRELSKLTDAMEEAGYPAQPAQAGV